MATSEESRDFMLHYYLVLYGILYYDYFATVHKEYRRIWKSRWSVVKILFFVNRYLMIVESILILVGFTLHWPSHKCDKYFIPWQAILPIVISAAGGLLLILRTYAIWSRARWVLWVLCPLLAAQVGANTYLATAQQGALVFKDDIGPCLVSAKNSVMDLYCILPMLFDIVTSGLCVYRGITLQREAGNFASALVRNFTRHGTLYLIGAAAANVSNLAFMAISTKEIGLPTVPSNGGMVCTVFSSIFISRLAMSLKGDDQSKKRRLDEVMLPLTSASDSSTARKTPTPLPLSGRNSRNSERTMVSFEYDAGKESTVNEHGDGDAVWLEHFTRSSPLEATGSPASAQPFLLSHNRMTS